MDNQTQLKSLTADSRIERLLIQAREAGCPRDQIERFLQHGYIPFPEMLPFHAAARECDRHDGPDSVALGGTRGPGKTHAAMAQVGLDDCQRFPGLKVLFLRHIMKSSAEAVEDIVPKIFLYTDHKYTESDGTVEFSNGSRILIGGYKNEGDIDKYLGVEYDEIVIEECTQFSETRRQKISGSLRSTKPGWREREYLTTNPDGIGVTWFKRDFVTPWQAGPEAERINRIRFIFCHWRNNPLLSDRYIRWLNSLTGALADAWREGNFDAFEGMALPNWQHSLHVITPYGIPQAWVKWRALDYGLYPDPYVCLWFAMEPHSGRIIVYREIYATNIVTTQQAKMIQEMTPPNEAITITYADPSMFQHKSHKDKIFTIADDYKEAGIILTPADNDRYSGKAKLEQKLALLPDGKPGIQFFNTCVHTVETLPNLVLDKTHTWDVDTRQDDHCLVGNTMIDTDRGRRKLTDLTAGDRVLTRSGYCDVIRSWLTTKDADIYNVLLSNQTVIRGTCNHPVFVFGKGFIPIDTLRYGDILLTKECVTWLRLLFLMGLNFVAIQALKLAQHVITMFQEATIVKRVLVDCTKKFGNTIMGIFQKTIASIIKMGISLTIQLKIWNAFQFQTTPLFTSIKGCLKKNTWKRSDRWQLSGIDQLSAGSGIPNTLNKFGRIERWQISFVNFVAEILKGSQKETREISVQINAARPCVEKKSETTKQELVGIVERYLRRINIQMLKLVRVNVVQVCTVKKETYKEDVYNLTVKDHNEYFANGILVHNCYDTIRYGLTNQRQLTPVPLPNPYNKSPLQELSML